MVLFSLPSLMIVDTNKTIIESMGLLRKVDAVESEKDFEDLCYSCPAFVGTEDCS